MIEEKLLGFDARELWLNPEDLWDEKRRDLFLLRVDAPKPISTDTLVWPSLFDTGQGIGLPASERARLHLSGIPVPSWIGPNTGLWENLGSMRQYVADNWTPRPNAIVAVCWYSDHGFSEAGNVGPYACPTAPATRSDDWKSLGFDVADGSLTSGLSNCGYSSEEVEDLRLKWRDRLNSRHLFADLNDAFAFRDLADKRVPEHAPFFVYGLCLIDETSWLWVKP